jgi:hypothetical protein
MGPEASGILTRQKGLTGSSLNLDVDAELVEFLNEATKISFIQDVDSLPQGLLSQRRCHYASREIQIDFLDHSVVLESPIPLLPCLGTKGTSHSGYAVNVNILLLHWSVAPQSKTMSPIFRPTNFPIWFAAIFASLSEYSYFFFNAAWSFTSDTFDGSRRRPRCFQTDFLALACRPGEAYINDKHDTSVCYVRELWLAYDEFTHGGTTHEQQ